MYIYGMVVTVASPLPILNKYLFLHLVMCPIQKTWAFSVPFSRERGTCIISSLHSSVSIGILVV